MNEGGLIKIYAEKKQFKKSDVAAAIGVPEAELDKIYQSQTVEPAIKKKLADYFKTDIFDGSMLAELKTNVPDEQPNKSAN